ncbi:hypothetical protein M6B38_268370 [Iris pallida]|uniref:Uncharacterized protein n=1 Tax=Iris pallida TaxID=29817 RepID=A0AAX6G578_IRIPA|nr:hypothetical protein M6B38_129235 [Iris pallida]KAJ6849714.1 hypothetical protein M6B38_268370 [Iris pallida]
MGDLRKAVALLARRHSGKIPGEARCDWRWCSATAVTEEREENVERESDVREYCAVRNLS